MTIDLDSTICETYGLAKEGARHHSYAGQRTYGLAKEGARHHSYAGQRGYHPLLAIAAGPGDVLMSRLRQHRSGRRLFLA